MSDDQTAEQKAANEQLDEAIRRVSLAYGYDGVVTTWVVSASYVTASASGEGSGVGLFFPGGVIPWAAAIGCLRLATLKLENYYLGR